MQSQPIKVKRAVNAERLLIDKGAEILAALHAMRMDGAFDAINEIRHRFAEHRALFGFKAEPCDLTKTHTPDTATNLKIKKNALPTVSLTMSSATNTMPTGMVVNTCSHSTAGCRAVCVLQHGKGQISSVQRARMWRTYCFITDPVGFTMLLRWELMKACRFHGDVAVRLNVNSDLPWHTITDELFYGLPVKAYDYTKNDAVLFDEHYGWYGEKYRLVYSFSERTRRDPRLMDAVDAFLLGGGTVAVVTDRKKGQPIMSRMQVAYEEHRVIDGDETDLRFDDPSGVIVDLYAKGFALSRKSALVQRMYNKV